MRYRTVSGRIITASASRPTIMQFIASPARFRYNLSSKIEADKEAKRLGVPSLQQYLGNAVATGNCIIVQRDDITFDLICKKLTARIDSEMLECICVWETSF